MQREESPWAGRVEALPGDVLNRALVANRNDHCLLLVLVPGYADARQFPDAGGRAIGAHHQLALEFGAVLQGHSSVVVAVFEVADGVVWEHGNRGQRRGAVP